MLFAFIQTVITFSHLESGASGLALIGADNELGYPSSALALAVFTLVVAVGVGTLSGGRFGGSWWTALVVILSLATGFELWATVLQFTPLLLVQLILAAAALAIAVPRILPLGQTVGLGIFLVVASSIGLFAAFRLTVEKVVTYVSPDARLTCNLSVLVQCGKNLASWQGSLFGFPNPLLGLGGWTAALLVGLALLSGIRFARGFWIAFAIGVAGALALVIWLISQSIFVLGTLCPWCMVTWAVTIPTFWAVAFHVLKTGAIPVPSGARRFFAAAYTWVPLITLLSYLVVALIAQGRLDVIHHWG